MSYDKILEAKKTSHPSAIVFLARDDKFTAYDQDAEIVSREVGVPTTPIGRHIAAIVTKRRGEAIARLISAGHNVIVRSDQPKEAENVSESHFVRWDRPSRNLEYVNTVPETMVQDQAVVDNTLIPFNGEPCPPAESKTESDDYCIQEGR
jgi:DNA mismatch repair ATPase MutS